MVAFNSILSIAATIAGIVPMVSATALPREHRQQSSVVRREDNWDEYHKNNENFARIGVCRYYLDPTDRDGLWPCRQYCQSDSVTCNGNANADPSTIHANPNGERYTYGECWCSNPALEVIVEFTAEGLKELPGITCAVWLQALKESVKLGTWAIPGVGPAAKAVSTIIKSVKLADFIGGKEGWANFIQNTCGIENWDFDIYQSFDIMSTGPSE